MTSHGSKRFPTHHGYGEVRVSRYFALYATQIGWLALGAYLLLAARWPSSCSPDTVMKFIACSGQLPDNGGWREAALATWIWSTPLLVALELSRRFGKTDV